jgi:hypothetical protein
VFCFNFVLIFGQKLYFLLKIFRPNRLTRPLCTMGERVQPAQRDDSGDQLKQGHKLEWDERDRQQADGQVPKAGENNTLP